MGAPGLGAGDQEHQRQQRGGAHVAYPSRATRCREPWSSSGWEGWAVRRRWRSPRAVSAGSRWSTGTWSRRPTSTASRSTGAEDVGRSKVTVAAERLRRAYPGLEHRDLAAAGCRADDAGAAPRPARPGHRRHRLGGGEVLPQRRGGAERRPAGVGRRGAVGGPGDADRPRRGVPPLPLRRGAGARTRSPPAPGRGCWARSPARWARSRRRWRWVRAPHRARPRSTSSTVAPCASGP